MNKSGFIYMIVSIIAVIGVSFFVLLPDDRNLTDEITLTVMSTETIVSDTQRNTTQTTILFSSICTATKYTVTAETVLSSISTNSEPEITSTEPVTTVYEEVYVDINTADIDELMKINGIGEVTAAEIIKYREQNGGFRNIEEIMNVYGIGEAVFWHICDYIYVENPIYDVEEEVTEEVTEPETVPETIPETETESEITLQDVAPININTAGIELLILLPNVNEQIAQDIITLREQLHGFSHVYELLYVEKLEQKQVAELEEFVTVGQ